MMHDMISGFGCGELIYRVSFTCGGLKRGFEGLLRVGERDIRVVGVDGMGYSDMCE